MISVKNRIHLIALTALLPMTSCDPVHHLKLENKTMREKSGYTPTLISGAVLLVLYICFDYLFSLMWILITIPFSVVAIVFIVFFIKAIIKTNKQGIIAGALVIGVISTIEIYESQLFKNKKLLEASLIDDRAGIHLTLREGNRFEVVSSTPFSQKEFTGTYQLVDNKIIFNHRPYDNDFIPDTLTIVDDKVILRFDKEGNPITEFATFFKIQTNNILTID